MSKRELRLSNGAADTEGLRAKRRKEAGIADQDISMSEPVTTDENVDTAGAKSSSTGSVKEQGLELWNTIKNAVNKEGRIVSPDFMRRPSKKVYADYYILIQHPIALDDIKKKLDMGAYHSFETVKQDFELCFSNAKKYNMKESGIWKDAKFLHKLTLKEYNRMTGEDEQIDIVHDGREAGDDEGDEGGKKKGKTKPANMNRLLKSRLQKLVDKTDDTGRVLSTEFMELPSKKLWPTYYKEIKRPQCIENIFKRLKRKEYITSVEFAADVELVFSNAFAFNHEHTPIWEDALLLRDTFRQLMSDLPEPHALPEYSKPSQKIKLKVPAPQPSSSLPSAPPPAATLPSTSSTILRLPSSNSINVTQNKAPAQPAHASPKVNSTSLPIQPSTSTSASASTAAPVLAVRKQATPVIGTQPTLQSVSYPGLSYSQHYPNASYQQPGGGALTSSTAANLPTTSANRTPHRDSPAPPHYNYLLEGVTLTTIPRGRPFLLDHRDGVKSWATRLSHEESGLYVKDIRFLGEEEEEESAPEDGQEDHKDDKEEEEEESEAEAPVKNGRRRGKGKGRGRQKAAAAKGAAAKAKAARGGAKKASKPKMEEVQVKLNGTLAKEDENRKGEWRLDLPVGPNIVEIGEKGGMVWKVFAERVPNTHF